MSEDDYTKSVKMKMWYWQPMQTQIEKVLHG